MSDVRSEGKKEGTCVLWGDVNVIGECLSVGSGGVIRLVVGGKVCVGIGKVCIGKVCK